MTLPAVLGLAAEGQDLLIAELMSGVEATCAELGTPTRNVMTSMDEAAVPVLLAIGYPGFYPDLMARPRSARRVLWYGENLPPVGSDTLLAGTLRAFPSARAFDLLIRALSLGGRRPPDRLLLRWRERAAVEREWARNRRGLLAERLLFDRIVVTSQDRATSARRVGVPVSVSPFGYHERSAGRLQPAEAPRDLDVVVFGTDLRARTRRGAILRQAEEGLRPSITPTLMDHGLYGPDRERLLGRTRVVLDIHRVPGNFNGLRFMFAAAAGAVLVSEPCDDPRPLVPGEHYVEAAVERLPDAIRDILADEPRRRRIVEAGQELLRGELAMRRTLERVIAD